MLRTPPHILVTTPESLYLLLTAERSREMLRTVRTVIVDEIHAVIGTRRGAHLALSLERLQQVAERPLLRHRPVGDAEADRGGGAVPRRDATARPCAIVDEGHRRADGSRRSRFRGSPLDAVMSHEVWEEYYDRLAALIERAPDDAGVRQHAADGRAPGAAPERAARRGGGHRASRQPRRRRTRLDAETRLKSGRAARAGRHRVARARHRHRPRRPGLPDRLAASHRHAAAARRPLRPHRRRHAEGPAVPDVARRSGRVRGAAARGPPRRARRIVTHDAPLDVLAQQIVAETRVPRLQRGRAVRAGAARLAVSRSRRAQTSTPSWR